MCWYTSMLGKKSSLRTLRAVLRAEGLPPAQVATTIFRQGFTRRWALAWTFSASAAEGYRKLVNDQTQREKASSLQTASAAFGFSVAMTEQAFVDSMTGAERSEGGCVEVSRALAEEPTDEPRRHRIETAALQRVRACLMELCKSPQSQQSDKDLSAADGAQIAAAGDRFVIGGEVERVAEDTRCVVCPVTQRGAEQAMCHLAFSAKLLPRQGGEAYSIHLSVSAEQRCEVVASSGDTACELSQSGYQFTGCDGVFR